MNGLSDIDKALQHLAMHPETEIALDACRNKTGIGLLIAAAGLHCRHRNQSVLRADIGGSHFRLGLAGG
ncbi:MAG TPA: hypothetical protein VM639_08800 [Dongiaceae bacterium]|nr:hypothetical protein [Dongiaceae bacterium]